MSFPFSFGTGSAGYGGFAGNAVGGHGARPTRLRPVTLSHLTPPAPSAPASQRSLSQQQVSVSPSEAPSKNGGGVAPQDPFLPSPPSQAQEGLPRANAAQSQSRLHQDGASWNGPPAASANVAKWSAFGLNTSRYVAGVPLTPHGTGGSSLPQADGPTALVRTASHPQTRCLETGTQVSRVDSIEVDDEVLFCGSSSASSSQAPLSNTSMAATVDGASHTTRAAGHAAGGSADGYLPSHNNTLPVPRTLSCSAMQSASAVPEKHEAQSESLHLLRRQLSELSARVNEAAEFERCGPPKPGGGKGGGPSFGGANRWRSKKQKKDANVQEGEDASEEPLRGMDSRGGKGGSAARRHRGRDSDEHAANTSPARSRQKQEKTENAEDGDTRGDDHSNGDAVANESPRSKKAPPVKRGGKKAPAKRSSKAAGNDHKARKEKNEVPPWRTMFSLGPGGQGTPGDGQRGAETLPTGATNADGSPVDQNHTGVTVIPSAALESDDAVAALYEDVEAALNDPDRIQAPPLFVGLLYTNGDSNFSLSAASRGTALLPPVCAFAATATSTVAGATTTTSPSHATNPREAHRYVSHVVVRWRDKVFSMAAHRFGFPFLLRVVHELVGVEVITFDAPAVLLPLLCSAVGEVTTHCVSDARIMAWMAALTLAAGSDGNAGPCGEYSGTSAPVSVHGTGSLSVANALVYDYTSVLEQYVGGTAPAAVTAVMAPGDHKSVASQNLQRLVHETFYLAPLYRALYGHLGARGLLQAFLRQEKRIPLLIASMKRNGIRVNMREVQRFKTHCTSQMNMWRSKACSFVPQLVNFNIQSPDQVRVALYEILDLGKYLLPSHTQKSNARQSFDARDVAPDEELSTENAVVITKGGKLSTAEGTLRLLSVHHEFPRCVLHYRKFAKVLQTYVEGMMSYAVPCGAVAANSGTSGEGGGHPSSNNMHDAFEDRSLTQPASHSDASKARQTPTPTDGSPNEFASLHPNFLQEGTDTGRLSCAEPNLQNLPRTAMDVELPSAIQHSVDSGLVAHKAPLDVTASPAAVRTTNDGEEADSEVKEEFMFRRCFIAPSSSQILLSVDFQQIELRVLAHLCADSALINALTTGNADIHRSIAEILFKKKPVTAEERNMSKRVVFGVLYGAGPRTLASQMGVTVERAIFVSSLLRTAFPQIHAYHQKIIQQGREEGYVRTLSGRIRQLPDINSGVMGRRAYAERQAFNTVVQGSAADVMKMAMLAVERDVLRPLRGDVQLLMQIHDEMIFAVEKEKLAVVVPLVTRSMSRAMSLLVPLAVTAKFGPSLGEFQEWTVDHELGLV